MWSEAECTVLMRRIGLLLSTWVLARICETLRNIVRAIDIDAAAEGAVAGKAPGIQEPSVPMASKPTLVAGYSCPKMPMGAGVDHSWTPCDASHFRVRCGPNYPKLGRKEASGPALGEVVAMDTLRMKKKCFRLMATGHIALPEPSPDWDETYPEFLVVNQMLPVHFNSALVAGEHADGETVALVFYVRLKRGLSAWRSDRDPEGAEQLLRRFLLRADQDAAIAHAFKEIGRIEDFGELEGVLPSSVLSLLKRFNGKPVLTRPEHSFYRDPQNRFFECDIDGHRYKYLTRTAVHKSLPCCKHLKLEAGFVVEARKEAEMPEVMALCCVLHKLQLDKFAAFPPPPQ
mmetsp:Transcript_28766/g.49109  ORF Transcript_28766/g.49109 Transcript_28766/m.49109 type:complete len:345 (+) Transcript_28766:1-1035(+)